MTNCLRPALIAQTAIALSTTAIYFGAASAGLATINFEIEKTCETWRGEIKETKHDTVSQYLESAYKTAFCELGPPVISLVYTYAVVKSYSLLMFGSCSAPTEILKEGLGNIKCGLIGLFNACLEHIAPGVTENNANINEPIELTGGNTIQEV